MTLRNGSARAPFTRNNGAAAIGTTATVPDLALWLDADGYTSGPWRDRSGHGNHATFVGTPPTHDGVAFDFDGVDDYATIADSTSLRAAMAGEFGVEVWVQPNGAGDALLGKANWAAPQNASGIMLNADIWYREGTGFGGGYAHAYNSGPYAAMQHLVVTRSGTAINSYRNNVHQYTFGFADSSDYANSEEMRVGRTFHNPATAYLNGRLVVVRVWTIYLDAPKRAALYQQFIDRAL